MWVDVKDRLPEAFQRVACQVLCLGDWIGGFHDGDLWNIDHYGELAAHGIAGWKVVRWLPLPPPPEEYWPTRKQWAETPGEGGDD